MVLLHYYMHLCLRTVARAVAAVDIGPEAERKIAVVRMLAEDMVFVVVRVLIGSRHCSTTKAFRMHGTGLHCCCSNSPRPDHLAH